MKYLYNSENLQGTGKCISKFRIYLNHLWNQVIAFKKTFTYILLFNF